MTFLVTVKTVLVSRLNMGVWLSKIRKESKSERDFQRHTRKSRRSKSFTLNWTGRKRSKANRASTRSENLSPELKWKDNTKSQTKWHADINADQTCSSNAFDTNRRHTTTVEEQSENKNYFQDACIPTNQDTTVKPKSTNKSNLDIAHEIVLQIENRRAGKAKRMKTSQNSSTTGDMKKNSSNLLKGTGNKSTGSQQHNRISSTNQKISLLANNTNSLVRDSDISKIGSKKAASVKLIPAESKTKIIDVNAQAVIQKAISDGQEKKTVQHENLQKVKQNRKQAILHDPLNIIDSNKLASVELEDKTKKNILTECKTKVISANTQEVIEPIEEIKTSNNQNAISDGQQPKKFQVMKQNYESRENIIFLSHIFMDKIDVEKEKINLPWQDFTNFKEDTGNRQNCDNATLAKAIEDRSNMDGKSKEENSAPTTLVDVTPKFEQNDEMNDEENIFKELTILFQENIPICDQVVKSGNVETDEDNLQCQEADEVVYQSTKYEPCDSVLLPIVCDNVKLQTTEVNILTEAVDETSSKPKQLDNKVDKVDEKEYIPSEKIVKLLQDDQTIPLNSDALWLSSKQIEKTAEDTIFRKNIKTFLMQDCEEIDLCANKADQENSISENPFCTKVKEQFLELTGEAISSHNDCADDTVNQNNPEGLYYSEDEHITSDNLFMQKSIDESDNASDKVSKPRKDEIDNVFEDLLILVKEDNLKTTSLSVSVSIPENNSSPNARDEVGQKITDYTVAKKIEDIKCKAEPFREEIEAFFELEDSNKYFYIEESLQRLVAKLDDMYDEIGDDEWLRQRRKFVYKFIFSLFDALDEKVKINARNVQL